MLCHIGYSSTDSTSGVVLLPKDDSMPKVAQSSRTNNTPQVVQPSQPNNKIAPSPSAENAEGQYF
jgi:hypothetical protein